MLATCLWGLVAKAAFACPSQARAGEDMTFRTKSNSGQLTLQFLVYVCPSRFTLCALAILVSCHLCNWVMPFLPLRRSHVLFPLPATLTSPATCPSRIHLSIPLNTHTHMHAHTLTSTHTPHRTR